MTGLFDPQVLGWVMFACLMGGLVKGVLGFGMPLIALPLMVLVLPLPTAIALLVVPILTSNVQQIIMTGYLGEVWRRFRVMIVIMPVVVLVGVQFLLSVDSRWLELILGVVILIISGISTVRPPELSRRAERVLTPLVGVAAGLIGGISSINGPVVAVYLVALRVTKDVFITTVAATFLITSVPLQTVLAFSGVLGLSELALSALTVIPVTFGVWLGARLRNRLSQVVFRRVVLTVLVVISLSLIHKSVIG